MVTNGENSHARHVKRFLKRIKQPHTALSSIRQKEAEDRYAMLPGIKVHYCKLPDGELSTHAPLSETCQALLQNVKPDIIYLPETGALSRYTHQDHLHLGQVITDLKKACLPRTALRYYHSKQNNCFLDVSSHIQEARTALNYYKSQRIDKYISEFILQKYYGWQQKNRYSECFREVGKEITLHAHKGIKRTDPPLNTDDILRQSDSSSYIMLCGLLALVSLIITLGTQKLMETGGFALSLLTGTGAGLLAKYWLEKPFRFNFRMHGALRNRKAFGFYILSGITAIGFFWGMEYGFRARFERPVMPYVGGALGLAAWYTASYLLEKRYVFSLFSIHQSR
jgi:LmbE family N-acetylglucosaminyl deacetylase